MSKVKKEQTIESLKIQAIKVHYRYILAIAILGALVIGVISGYFASIDVISNAQKTVVNSIVLTSKQVQ